MITPRVITAHIKHGIRTKVMATDEEAAQQGRWDSGGVSKTNYKIRLCIGIGAIGTVAGAILMQE